MLRGLLNLLVMCLLAFSSVRPQIWTIRDGVEVLPGEIHGDEFER